jgi:hypothetical protein
MGHTGKLVYSLQVLLGTPSSGCCLGGLVILDATDDLIAALALVDMGDGDVEILLDNSTIDQLLYGHTDSALVHVKDDTSAAVVVLVGHTLVNGRVDLDINIVSSLRYVKKGGNRQTGEMGE